MIANRKELRGRVEHQQKLLEQALHAVEPSGPADRITALKTELSVVSDSLSGGWDKMTDTTAEALSKWLETTRNLVIAPKNEGQVAANTGKTSS
jgi:hypothetical protein